METAELRLRPAPADQADHGEERADPARHERSVIAGGLESPTQGLDQATSATADLVVSFEISTTGAIQPREEGVDAPELAMNPTETTIYLPLLLR